MNVDSETLSSSIEGSDNINCNGGSEGSIEVFVSGGVAPYQYSINAGSNYQSSNKFSGLTAGTYTIKVRDANFAGALSDKEIINEQILIGNGNGFTSAALSQDVLMTNAGVVTIQPDVVTNTKLANMPAVTMKVNATGSVADPQDLALGNYTIVGAGAVVTKSFEEGYCVIAGNPAKIIKKLNPLSNFVTVASKYVAEARRLSLSVGCQITSISAPSTSASGTFFKNVRKPNTGSGVASATCLSS